MAAADYQTPERMGTKLRAIPLPFMLGKRVLDVGCDAGFFSFLSAAKGASYVLGLDRNRHVRGVGFVDLVELNRQRARDEGRSECHFQHINVGKQWHEFGQFDVILLFSLYHHIFEAAGGDHNPIWYWLWRHCARNAVLLWENPVDDADAVVRANVSPQYRDGYTLERIMEAAGHYFLGEYVGPALHEPHRQVWRFRPRARDIQGQAGKPRQGAGGASKAFAYADGRRIEEIAQALGARPFPGSLNVSLGTPFDWSRGYYRARILDVVDRRAGLHGVWAPRWGRFYPVDIGDTPAFAMRFEGEAYPETLVELIAPARLRDRIAGPLVINRTLPA